jgi:hypothetical protein
MLQRMPNVFVSYSSRDVDFVVQRLVPRLEQAGATVWCSAKHLRQGGNWERQIRAALSSCDWFVVVLSPHAQRSDWVQAETHWAVEHVPGRVVPLMLDHCKPDEVHLLLATVQFIDLRDDAVRGLAELTRLMFHGAGQAATSLRVRSDREHLLRTAPAQRPRSIELRVSVQRPGAARDERRVRIINRAIVGRAADVGFRICDASVSRRHARLDVLGFGAETALTVTDLNSSNGTYVNGVLVQAPHRVELSDLLLFGDVELRVVRLAPAEHGALATTEARG